MIIALAALALTLAVYNIEAQSVDSIADKGTDGVSVPTSWSAGPNLPNPVVRAVGVYFPAQWSLLRHGRPQRRRIRERSDSSLGIQSGYQYLEYHKAGTYPDNQVNNMACGVLTVAGPRRSFASAVPRLPATTATPRVFSYDPVTDVVTPFTVADNWPGAQGAATTTILPGGFAVVANKLYIVGGYELSASPVPSKTWQFDPNAAVGSRWLQRLNFP